MNIRVKLTRSENYNYHGVSSGTVVTLDLEEYLKGVVPAEMSCGSDWPDAALKAQAIAARSYAIYHINHPKSSYDLNDTTAYQAYRCSRFATRTNNIVTGTAGLVLTYASSVIESVFSACNGGTTVSSQSKWGHYHPFLIAQADPWDAATGEAKDGHGVGMSQLGAQYAGNHGVTYHAILNFYYPTTSLVSDYGSGSSGGSGTGATYEGIVATGNSYPLNVRAAASVSSTKLGELDNGTALQVIDYNSLWYQIDFNGQTAYIMKHYVQLSGQGGGTETIIGVVATGNSYPLNVRAAASTSSTLLGTVANGITLQLIDYNTSWYQFTFNGQTAYVMKQFIQVSGQGGGVYLTWQDKYGNNTFVESYTYSGNVARYQSDLNLWLSDHGYSTIIVDGKYGNNTMNATSAFQSHNSLTVDGIAGPQTKAALFAQYN